MIFRTLFTPKYQHSDAKVRKKAAQSLSVDNAKHKTVLHELAFNDESADVSIAALQQLNSFPLWLKMSQIARDPRVKKTAVGVVTDAIVNSDNPLLDDKERRTIVVESQDPFVIRLAVSQTTLFEDSPTQLHQLLETLNDTLVTRQVFNAATSEDIQLLIVERCTDFEELKRLSKSAFSDIVSERINDKLSQIQRALELPIQLSKTLTLNLSKLQALLDKTNYRDVVDRRQSLEMLINADLDALQRVDSNTAKALVEKYDNIVKRLSALQQRLEPDYLIELAEQEKRRELTEWQSRANETLEMAENALIESVLQSETQSFDTAITGYLTELLEQAETLAKAPQRIPEKTLARLRDCVAQCQCFEDIGSQYRKLETQIADLENNWNEIRVKDEFDTFLATIKPVNAELNTAHRKYKHSAVVSAFTSLKERIESSNRLLSTTQKAMDDVISLCRQKSRVSSSLIQQGRFNPAIAIFEEYHPRYLDLPESKQRAIAILMEQWRSDITELQDLKSYVAVDRKPKLLDEMQKLAATPMQNAAQRKHDVTRLRKDYASLGQLGTEQDAELNQAFNVAADHAYMPAKDFFAAQNEQQQTNAKKAEAMLVELENCLSVEEDQTFLQRLSTLQKQWRSLGKLSHQDYKVIKRKRSEILQRTSTRSEQIYQQNAALKNQLIARVTDILNAMPDDARDRSVALQHEWKQIGFAGPKQDQQLWHTFRQQNDAVFDALKASKARAEKAIQAAEKRLTVELQNIEAECSQTASASTQGLKALLERLDIVEQTFLSALNTDTKDPYKSKVFKNGKLAIQRVSVKLAKLQRQAIKADQRASYQALFELLGQNDAVENPLDLSVFPFWSNSKSPSNTRSRRETTVQLEIRCGLPTPDSDESLRQSLQMEMMREKLEGGDLPSVDQLLCNWVNAGSVGKDEIIYLQRAEKAVLANVNNGE